MRGALIRAGLHVSSLFLAKLLVLLESLRATLDEGLQGLGSHEIEQSYCLRAVNSTHGRWMRVEGLEVANRG
jgi:hypothetical protein